MSETEGQQVTTQETGRCEKAAHEVTHASWNHRFHESVFQMATAATIDRLVADVASIKAKIDAVSPEDVKHFVESEKAWVKLVEEQRDAAIRERDEARAEAQRIQDEADDQEQTDKVKRLNAEIDKIHYTLMNRTWERDEARAEVERLNAELAARQAADVQRIGWIARHNHAPPVGKYVMCRWDVEARQGYARQVSYGAAKRGPDGMWLSPTGVEKIAPMHWMPLPPGVEGGDEWEQQPPAAPQPAGHGISPGLPETQSAGNAAPPAGWLTGEERAQLWFTLDRMRRLGYSPAAEAIESILSRAGSPPVVEVPALGFLGDMTGREQGIVLAYRDALDKAGVAWKAVPRE